jgi:hypothetical protein
MRNDEKPGRLPLPHASVSGSVSPSESKTKRRMRLELELELDGLRPSSARGGDVLIAMGKATGTSPPRPLSFFFQDQGFKPETEILKLPAFTAT